MVSKNIFGIFPNNKPIYSKGYQEIKDINLSIGRKSTTVIQDFRNFEPRFSYSIDWGIKNSADHEVAIWLYLQSGSDQNESTYGADSVLEISNKKYLNYPYKAYDSVVHFVGSIIKNKLDNNNKIKIIIAPYPEFNNHGVSAEIYKSAYRNLWNIFMVEKNMLHENREQIQWAFCPNSLPYDNNGGYREFYPGQYYTDIISISAFRFGKNWYDGDATKISDTIGSYLKKLKEVDPYKPLIIGQTGAGILHDNGNYTEKEKADWIDDLFTTIKEDIDINGAIYFNADKESDWRIFGEGVSEEVKDVVKKHLSSNTFTDNFIELFPSKKSKYYSPFVDVSGNSAHPFTGKFRGWIPWYYHFVNNLYLNGVSSGYGTVPPEYKPHNLVTRAEIAVFVLRAKYGSSYVPPESNGSIPDINNGYWFDDWCADFYNKGYINLVNGKYYPNKEVTRDEMCVFVAKGMGQWEEPQYNSYHFPDIKDHKNKNWVEFLFREDVVIGYEDGTFRPNNRVRRSEMAVFLVRGFNL